MCLGIEKYGLFVVCFVFEDGEKLFINNLMVLY